MGAVRTTQKQMHKDPRYKAYSTWKQSITWLWNQALIEAGKNPADIKFSVIQSLTFHLPVPKPRNDNKKIAEYAARIGNPHMMKPDIDNMIKSFMDALMKEDSHVHTIGFTKKLWCSHDKGWIDVQIVLD
jgi:Holliday junction resolvase RusA-like endonuclease